MSLVCEHATKSIPAETCLEKRLKGTVVKKERVRKLKTCFFFKLNRPFRWQPTSEMPVAEAGNCKYARIRMKVEMMHQPWIWCLQLSCRIGNEVFFSPPWLQSTQSGLDFRRKTHTRKL